MFQSREVHKGPLHVEFKTQLPTVHITWLGKSVLKIYWNTHHHPGLKHTWPTLPVLVRAIDIGHLDLINQLLAHGARIDPQDKTFKILISALETNPQSIKLNSAICLLVVLNTLSIPTSNMKILLANLLKCVVNESLIKCWSQFEITVIKKHGMFAKNETKVHPDLLVLRDLCLRYENESQIELIKQFLRSKSDNEVEAYFTKSLINKLKLIPKEILKTTGLEDLVAIQSLKFKR